MSRALLEATAGGHLAKVRQQLAKGGDVNCIHKPTGRTPLIEAVIHGHLDIAKELIEAGANVNHFDTAVEFSPLLWACEKGNEDMVDLLLSASADVNGRSREFGWMPLLVAAQSGSLPLIQKLLKSGADLHASTSDGRTAVAIARAAKKPDVAALLEALGCRAESSLAPPPKLAWPDVDSQASNVDFTKPESVVRGLIIAMNHYEENAFLAPSPDVLLAQMNAVYARFCTEKERVYGRHGSYQSPPEYDPATEFLMESNIVNSRRAEVITRNETSGEEYLYVLQKKAGFWRVDSKKYRRIGGNWSPRNI